MASTFSLVSNEETQQEDVMKQLKLPGGLLLSLLCVVAASMLTGCYYEEPAYPPQPPPPPYGVAYYDYYYYPDEEVYFYPATGVYFWFGGGGWHEGRHVPHGYVLHDRDRVNVHLNTPRPYERHEEIRGRYPARRAPEGGPERKSEDHREHGPR
jgi:hypothetical protein